MFPETLDNPDQQEACARRLRISAQVSAQSASDALVKAGAAEIFGGKYMLDTWLTDARGHAKNLAKQLDDLAAIYERPPHPMEAANA